MDRNFNVMQQVAGTEIELVDEVKMCYERCIVIGSGQFAFNCAKYLHDIYQLDEVYEYGAYEQSGLADLCGKNHFPYSSIDKPQCDALMEKLSQNKKGTLIVSASNTYIFPAFAVECSHIKIINYHPALLTRHLGRNAEAWAIYNQDDVAGVTWHEVTTQIDHGAILAEKIVELGKDITAVKLMLKQYRLGNELFREFIENILRDEPIEKKIVKEYGRLHYSYEKPNGGILDLTWGEEKISAFLRSMDYGTLNVMGKPILIEEGIRYEWDSYKILTNGECAGGWEKSFDKIIKCPNLVFVLHNFHRKNDDRGK